MNVSMGKFSTDTGNKISTLADLRRQLYLLFIMTEGISKLQFVEAAREAIHPFAPVKAKQDFAKEFADKWDMLGLYHICSAYLQCQQKEQALILFTNIDAYQLNNQVITRDIP